MALRVRLRVEVGLFEWWRWLLDAPLVDWLRWGGCHEWVLVVVAAASYGYGELVVGGRGSGL